MVLRDREDVSRGQGRGHEAAQCATQIGVFIQISSQSTDVYLENPMKSVGERLCKSSVGTEATYHSLICNPETLYVAPMSSQVAQSHGLMILVQPYSACGGTQTTSGVPAQCRCRSQRRCLP